MTPRRLLAGAATLLALLATTASPVHADTASAPFTASETINRTHLVNGRDSVVDTRNFSLTVGNTDLLRDREILSVSWTGAHPTGNIVGDRNSSLAAQEEYPVVLMQCRGTPDTVSPETCWTRTPSERWVVSSDYAFPPFRMDRYGTVADRRQVVGQPVPLPNGCASSSTGTQHWVPFVAADGTVYSGGLNGCAGLAPEADTSGGSLIPSNTTYGVTDLDGSGSAHFVINTVESNASLGCSQTVACSLVVVPIMGISCDAAGRLASPVDRPAPLDVAGVFTQCSSTGMSAAGALATGSTELVNATSGRLWWSASNWRNRIAVPLSFAAPANVCALSGHGTPSLVYGSQPLAQATSQWGPYFCLDPKLFTMNHVQTSDVQAKNLLENGVIDAAFAAAPPSQPFSKPVVQAPVAMSGFSISYVIDDADGRQYHDLKLTPRLLAKLLTASYPSNPAVKAAYKALSGNPLALPFDPEFQALNPNMRLVGVTSEPASTLFAMSSDSDVMTALTSYINADPDARAFLDGQPDPWGMVVNPNYKGISLPTASWQQTDTFEPKALYTPDVNPCLARSPVPWLPLVAAPVSSIATITLNLQFGIANSQVVCPTSTSSSNLKLTAVGREDPGTRFIIGVHGLADAARYQMDSAKLLTYTQPGAADRFTSDAGRTFVGPTTDGLAAAASLLTPSDDAGVWSFPYADLHNTAGDAGAYPGSMLFTLDVPTSGLKPDVARRYADYLAFVSGPGQTPGVGNGQLPAGYLPLTGANHLGAQSKYDAAAVAAISAQSGFVPKVSNPVAAGPAPTTAPTPTPTSTATEVPRPAPRLGSPRLPRGPVAFAVPPLTGAGRKSPMSASTPRGQQPSVALPTAALVTGLTPTVRAPAVTAALPWLAVVAVAGLAGAAVSGRLARRSPA